MTWSDKVVGEPVGIVPCMWPGEGRPGAGECKNLVPWTGAYCHEHTMAFYALLNAPLADGMVEPDARKRGGKADMSPEAKAARALAKKREAEAIEYVRTYAGNWGLPLDIRAGAKWGTKYLSLTERQVDALLAGKARDVEREAARVAALATAAVDPLLVWLAKPETWRASSFLASLASQARARGLSPRQREVAQRIMDEQSDRPATPEGRVAAGGPVVEGMYRTPEDVIYKVVKAVHGSGRLYAQRLEIDGTSGHFEYAGGAIRSLRPEWKMTLEEAKAFGSLYGFCVRCGATLTDDVSIKAGIGPICAGRF
jgi:hypothetical protein